MKSNVWKNSPKPPFAVYKKKVFERAGKGAGLVVAVQDLPKDLLFILRVIRQLAENREAMSADRQVLDFANASFEQ